MYVRFRCTFRTYLPPWAHAKRTYHLQLPHRTGSTSHDFSRDEVVVLTRATLVGVSNSSIGVVVDTLVVLLEELSRPYKSVHAHPIHILYSELYILELLGECCSTHWESINNLRNSARGQQGQESDSESNDSETDYNDDSATGAQYDKRRRASRNRLLARGVRPEQLPEGLVRRLMDAVKIFSRPVLESDVLPPSNILDDTFKPVSHGDPYTEREYSDGTNAISLSNGIEASQLLLERSDAIDSYTREIVEYASFSDWPRTLDYLKNALQQAAHLSIGSTAQSNNLTDDDRSALITARLISCYWVDSRKLSIIIQELCGCFLHLRKPFQTTVAIVLPLLITRWLERNPDEFIALHTSQRKFDGGAETLFDMSNTMFDGGKRKALLYPFQTSLLFLLPDVFEVASNMRDVKSSSISKKVSFLEMLRKALRNRNETSIYCLTSVLRVARHFPLESEAALLSYALDVQEEVREAVFRRYTPGMDAQSIDKDLMTASFVSLTHLNFEACVENLVPLCLSSTSPPDFKIAVISACSHFARQSNAEEYLPLFTKISEFIRAQLKVCYLVIMSHILCTNQMKGNASKSREQYSNDQYSLLKPLDTSLPPEMVYNILIFLDASPLTLFIGSPEVGAEWQYFFDDVFASTMKHLTADDEQVRYMANNVARKVMSDGSLPFWQRSRPDGSRLFIHNFWQSTYVSGCVADDHCTDSITTRSIVLIALCDRLITLGDEKSILGFIHDYLAARLKVLGTIEVCKFPFPS